MSKEILFVIHEHQTKPDYWHLKPVGDVDHDGPLNGIALPKEPVLTHKQPGDTIVGMFSDDYTRLEALGE